MQIRRRRANARRMLTVGILAVLASGCGGGDGGAGPGGGGPAARVPASITFDGGGTANGTVGAVLPTPVVAIIRTSDNLPVPRVTVQFTASSGTLAAASAVTDDQGRATAGAWTLGTTTGTQTVTAQTGSVSGQLVATAVAGTATRIELIAPLPAAVRAGTVITPAPAVRARDQFGNVVATAGLPVAATFQSGSGVLSGAEATTDATGTATFAALTIGGTVGTRALAFTSGTLPPITTAPIALEPGLPATIRLEGTPTSARAGVVIAPAIVATVSDRFDNVLSKPAITVSASISEGGGTVAGGAVTTDATGRAIFAALAIEGLVGDRRLRFTADQATATSERIPLFPGLATQLIVLSQPARAENTVPFADVVRVQIADRYSNGVGGEVRDVSATLVSGGGTLLPAVAVRADAAGVATFASLRIVGVTGPRTLGFASPGLSSATSAPIVLDAGPVRSMAFAQAPTGTITVGIPFAQQPVVQLADTSGNVVRRAGVLVRATLLDASGELLNDATLTDGSGLAVFRQLTYLPASPLPSTLRLRFGSGGQASLTTGSLFVQSSPASAVRSVTYGAPAQRLFIVDAGTSVALTAVARDAAGQPLPQVPLVYASANATVATVGSSGEITGVSAGSAWVRAFGAGAASVRDSVYVAVPRDASAPVVSTTRLTPIVVRQGIVSEFDIVLDTRSTTVGAATILVGMPPELVDGISWQGAAGTIIGFDSRFNALRISVVASAGLKGVFALARVRLTAAAADAFFLNREIVITPVEMVSADFEDLAARSTGVNIPLIP